MMVKLGEAEQGSRAEFQRRMQAETGDELSQAKIRRRMHADSGMAQKIGDEAWGDPWPRIRHGKLEVVTGERTDIDGRGRERQPMDQRLAMKCNTRYAGWITPAAIGWIASVVPLMERGGAGWIRAGGGFDG
jgi:hypothetical protein